MRLSEERLRFSHGAAVVDVEGGDQALRELLAHLFAPFLVVDSPTLPVAPARINVASFEGDGVLFDVEEEIAEALFHSTGRLALHAGAVSGEGLARGRTILILGASGSGKTTTTLELVRRGYRYLADEYTSIDLRGSVVYPFPRGAVLKRVATSLPSGRRLEASGGWGDYAILLPDLRSDLEPRELGELWLVFPEYRPGARAEARLLSSAEVCQQLLHATFEFEGEEDRLWPALSALVVRTKACAFEYGDIERDLDVALRCLEEQ